jgi:hypothetical protein
MNMPLGGANNNTPGFAGFFIFVVLFTMTTEFISVKPKVDPSVQTNIH